MKNLRDKTHHTFSTEPTIQKQRNASVLLEFKIASTCQQANSIVTIRAYLPTGKMHQTQSQQRRRILLQPEKIKCIAIQFLHVKPKQTNLILQRWTIKNRYNHDAQRLIVQPRCSKIDSPVEDHQHHLLQVNRAITTDH